MKILVVGENGQLGSTLKEISQNFFEANFQFVNSDNFDITNEKKIYFLFKQKLPL